MSGFDALREKGGSTDLAESDDEMNLPECSVRVVVVVSCVD